MRRKKAPRGGPLRWLVLALLLLAALLLVWAVFSGDLSAGLRRSPIYLPHGDVVFVPRG